MTVNEHSVIICLFIVRKCLLILKNLYYPKKTVMLIVFKYVFLMVLRIRFF